LTTLFFGGPLAETDRRNSRRAMSANDFVATHPGLPRYAAIASLAGAVSPLPGSHALLTRSPRGTPKPLQVGLAVQVAPYDGANAALRVERNRRRQEVDPVDLRQAPRPIIQDRRVRRVCA